jgi:hypothetical protein
MRQHLTLGIADISISIEDEGHTSGWAIPPEYRSFVLPGTPEVRLRLHRGAPDVMPAEAVFHCPPIWSLARRNGLSFVRIYGDLPGLERTLVLPDHLESADLYFCGVGPIGGDPFYGPTLELMLLNYLAQGRGAILHSCAVAREGRGLVFVGESGAGKSTLARLWAQEEGVTILSDDRAIVRKTGGTFRVYGTPWHGEAAVSSPLGVMLERIFFLRHGSENSLKECTEANAVARLLTCSFLPHWDAEGMTFSLEFLAELAAAVPCQELIFTPDRRAVELVEKLVG